MKHAKLCKKGMISNSSMMHGLGETEEEVKQAMIDLSAIGVNILTFGQYLQVSPVPAFDFGTRYFQSFLLRTELLVVTANI